MKMSIKTKLVSLTAFTALALMAVGATGIYIASNLNKGLSEIVFQKIPVIKDLGSIDMIHEGLKGSVLESNIAHLSDDQARIAKMNKEIEERKKLVTSFFKEVKEKNLSANVRSKVNIASKDFEEYIEYAEQSTKANATKDNALAHAAWEKFDKKFEVLEKSLDELTTSTEKESAESFSQLLEFGNKMSQFIVIFGGISLLASLVISWLTATGISKRLMHLNGNIGETSGSVGASVNQVSSAAQDVINALHEQTSALHQTGSAIEEISAMVHRSTEHSIEVNKKSKNSKELAENGKLVVDKLYEAIVHLKESNQNSAADLMDSNKKISSILSVINEVTNKTKIINDIVFQTKILSFNASVEAARAGENGKGFAVVADEVGKLAQMSGQAAKDINALLDACLIQVSSTVDETRQRIDNMIASSSELVNEGASVASECQDALSQILQSSLEVSQMVDEISAGSLESSKGVAEITKAIQEIDASSRLTSQAADICTTAAHDLTGEVEKIRTIANDLSHEVQGRSWINQFIWKNAFLLNVDDMDNQHKILIEKINLFATALDKGHLSEMKETYTDLESYTAEHFANEEKYLGQIEYPEIKAHKAIHSSLLAKLSEFSENLGSKDLNTNDLMNFLNDWLLKHILGVDMKYARFSRGERSESVVSLTYKRKDRHAA